MIECFDEVDQNDHVIRKITRDQAHQFKLSHRAVHIFFHDQSGKWLLQRRSAKKDFDPMLWTTSCSGHVDSGESYLEAAVRECKEELGIRISENQLIEILRCSACKETGMEFVRVYICNQSFEYFFPSADEITEISFFRLEDLLKECVANEKIFSGSFLHIFRLILWKLKYHSKES